MMISTKWLSLGLAIASLAAAQAPDWQVAAGGKKSFEVASVKPDDGAFQSPSFPLDEGEAFRPTGNRFRADFPLWTYIQFAYKFRYTKDQRESMQARLPKWVADQRFQIEARAEGTPTKDQFRLMMQSLLADRFKLTVHFETQDASVLFLTMVKPRKMGPNLRLHSDGPACPEPQAGPMPPAKDGDAFPPVCGVYAMEGFQGKLKLGSRNTTMALLAASLVYPGFGVSHPIVDKTGITERVDFSIECAEERSGPPPSPDAPAPEPQGLSFQQALHSQLGLTLKAGRDVIPILIVDHVERPSQN